MFTVLPLAAQMSTEHYLESQPQRRQESSGFIDFFYCIWLLPHRNNKHAISFPAVYIVFLMQTCL